LPFSPVFIFFFLSAAQAAFACGLEGHFIFNVSNKEEVLYYGCYDAINRGPHIIAYVLTKERAENSEAGRPAAAFTQDRDSGVLLNLLAENGYTMPHHDDYYYSGYDRGHMAPNADFNDTYENALATFFIANVWPQLPEINRGSWLRTEFNTRRLASERLAVTVFIIVEEFSGEKVENIHVPSCFKRRVYDSNTDELIYEIDVHQLTGE